MCQVLKGSQPINKKTKCNKHVFLLCDFGEYDLLKKLTRQTKSTLEGSLFFFIADRSKQIFSRPNHSGIDLWHLTYDSVFHGKK